MPAGPRSDRPVSLGVVVAAVLVAGAVLIGIAPLHDNSFLTHLATGRIILDSGIPRTDPYTFTAGGEPWVVQSWLASVLYAGLEDAVGLDGVRVLTGVLVGAVVALLWAATRSAPSVVSRLAVVVACGFASSLGWSERPLMFGLVSFGACLLASQGRLRGPWLVPIGWVWVNTHGSFPIGVALLLAVAAGEWLDGERPPPGLALAGWLTGGIALGALNPLGWRLLAFPLELLGRSGELRAWVVEWKPPAFESPAELAFLGLVVASVVAGARVRQLRLLLPAAAFIALALLSRRNVPLAAFAVAPLLAAAVPAVGSLRADDRPKAAGAVLGAVAVLSIALVSIRLGSTPATDLDAYPEVEVGWLADRGLVSPAANLVAPDYVGNYLEARFGPTGAVFFDDRFDMFPASVVEDYRSLAQVDDPGAVLERWDPAAVLWRTDEPLAGWLDAEAGWTRVFEGEDHAVWRRDDADR